MISDKLSQSLRVANVFCTILVVAIHYNTKHDMDLSSGFTWNYYLQEFITNGVARIAVPFFAFVAGFFFFLSYKSIDTYANLIKKRSRSILVPYLIASLLIFLVEYLYGVVQWELSFDNYKLFFTDIVLAPISVQFWFLRDLMFLILISPAIFILVRKFELWIVIPLMILWLLDIEIMPLLAGRYVITIETFSYFTLGCYLTQHLSVLDKLVHATKHQIFFVLISYLTLSIIRIILEPDLANWYTDKYEWYTLIMQNISIFIGVFLVIALSSKLINKKLLHLSQYTFFVYIFHLMPLSHLVGKITSYMISDAYKFYLTFPMAVLLVFLGAFICKKTLPTLYRVVSGGR